jgi:hypothetical protein
MQNQISDLVKELIETDGDGESVRKRPTEEADNASTPDRASLLSQIKDKLIEYDKVISKATKLNASKQP